MNQPLRRFEGRMAGRPWLGFWLGLAGPTGGAGLSRVGLCCAILLGCLHSGHGPLPSPHRVAATARRKRGGVRPRSGAEAGSLPARHGGSRTPHETHTTWRTRWNGQQTIRTTLSSKGLGLHGSKESRSAEPSEIHPPPLPPDPACAERPPRHSSPWPGWSHRAPATAHPPSAGSHDPAIRRDTPYLRTTPHSFPSPLRYTLPPCPATLPPVPREAQSKPPPRYLRRDGHRPRRPSAIA